MGSWTDLPQIAVQCCMSVSAMYYGIMKFAEQCDQTFKHMPHTSVCLVMETNTCFRAEFPTNGCITVASHQRKSYKMLQHKFIFGKNKIDHMAHCHGNLHDTQEPKSCQLTYMFV